jgi:predicted ribosomally synthesized peptide with SipW-like signal peptide
MAAVVATFTWAYFSDTATATATFSTGTVGLQICLNGSCSDSLDLPELSDIYPGWSHTTEGLELHNAGTLTMTVSITATETITSPLAEVIGVQIYRSPSPSGTPIFSGTFETLNTTGPYTYGLLAAEAYDDITFVFDWPDTGEDQSELAGKSLNEEITFYGTTEDVIQP